MKTITKRSSTARRFGRYTLALLSTAMIMSLFLPSSLLQLADAANSARPLVVPESTTYTTDADFATGTLFNVNNTAPNANQLQLNTTLSTFPVMWVANAGEDTVSKIDTTNNKELARYRTAFGPAGQAGYFNHINSAYAGAAPSRTAVDSDGNVYVANRHFDARPPEVFKILAEGGIDRNGNGTIETSIDADSNGAISVAEMLTIGDTNGNGVVDISEVNDERIAWVSRLPSTLPSGASNNGRLGRSLALDKNNVVWISASENFVYYKMNATTGDLIGGPISVAGHYAYGGLVDANGILWGATLGGGTLLKLDTNTNAVQTIPIQNGGSYGIALGNGKVYLGSNSPFLEYNPATNIFTPRNGGVGTSGVAVDSAGSIFAGSSSVQKWNSNGTVAWTSTAHAGTGYGVGIQVDSNGDVWQIDLSVHRICKFRGSDGFKLGCIPVGNSPYTYTDATGIGRFNTTTPSGKWTVVKDGGAAGSEWGTIAWNNEAQGNVPAGASIGVQVRSAETVAGLALENFAPVSNNVPFAKVGRYLEVQATLTANASAESPILSDLTITEVESAVATTAVLTSNTASVYGDNIVLTATISSASDVPTGSVEFFQGATSLGTSVLAAGIGTKSIPTLDVGSYPISVTYAGDDDFLGSTAEAVHVVEKAPSTVSVTCTTGAPFTYNGSPQTPCTAEANGVNLTPIDVSASLVYGSNTNAGPATASASWGGDLNHHGSVGNGGFTIGQLSASWTTQPNSKIFGNADPNPLTTGSGSGFLAGDNVTATYSRAVGEAVGSYPITATLSSTGLLSNYSITNPGASFSITPWNANGFYQPVGIPNTYTVLVPPTIVWNTIKAGQTVPLKFNIYAGSVEKFTVAAIQSFTVQEVGCQSVGSVGEDPVEVTSTGGTSLRYTGTPGSDGQFIQNWQTPNQPNRCYRTVMTAADGSMLVAFFKTKK